ncbi:MAG: peptidoglycan-binding protein [Elainellaceae cyanobacterium]
MVMWADLGEVMDGSSVFRHRDDGARSPHNFARIRQPGDRTTSAATRPQRLPSKRNGSVWKYLLTSALMLSVVVVGEGAIAQILAPGQTLQRGSSGSQVTQLQQELSRRGYFSGSFTGVYGQLTESAVERFQQASPRVAVDGVYGPETDAALFGIAFQPVFSSFNTPVNTTSFNTPNAVAGSRTLRLFDQGDDVEELQRLLSNRGYSPGIIDGVFGNSTQTAVRAFQSASGLSVDGVVGSATWSALGVSPTVPGVPGTGQDVALDALLSQGRYVVVVPGIDGVKLTTIERELGRTAYRTRSARGSFMTPGGYGTYRAARSDVLRLRAVGLDARVEYF